MAPEMKPLNRWLARFARNEGGAVLVEFALVLPMMLLVFGIIVEGSRMMIGYQSAIASVRDATRYLARIVPADICITGGPISAYNSQVGQIANQNLGSVSLPGAVTVQSVSVLPVDCTHTGFRISPAPVVTVQAVIVIAMPFSGLFTLSGGNLSTITTTISDSAKVFGA